MTLSFGTESNLNNHDIHGEKYSNAYLKERIYENKNRYLNKLICPKIKKAPKYMILAKLFLIINANHSFQKEPSQYLENFIKNWDDKTNGNEIIMKKFIKCVYGKNET